MALIGNYSLLNRSPKLHFGGGVVANFPSVDQPEGSWKNRQYGGFSTKSGTPNGYLHGGSFVLPMKPGSISSYVNAQELMTVSSAIAYMGLNMVSPAASVLTLTNAQLDQVIAMIASSLLAISVSNGGLSAAVDGSGSSALVLTLTNAQLGGIFDVVAASTMSIAPSVTFSALAGMIAAAGGPTPLSPEGLAIAVWDAVAVDSNNPGTMGEKLNAAGAAANPWTEVIESGYTASEVMKILLAVASGKTTVVNTGGGTATVKFRNVADTKDRVATGMVNSDRTTVTLDVT